VPLQQDRGQRPLRFSPHRSDLTRDAPPTAPQRAARERCIETPETTMNQPGKQDDHKDSAADHLVDAYEEMLKRTEEGITQARESAPKLRHMLETVRDNMVELGELTREEAHKIADYIERDIEDAAAYIAETGEDLREWWRFDIELMEQRLLDAFTSVADQTSLQLGQWAQQARRASLYQAGQITGPGTLICDQCGAETHFTRSGRIPPCADCGGLAFRRADSKTAKGESSDQAGSAS
jgi:polyhydroxyalkanoate synthesis regulator phasin